MGGLAGAYLLTYMVMAVLRMGYPYELEWLEGGVVDHVRWILAGNALYGAPSFEFTPFIYAPLYYYFSAAACSVFGIGFLPLRLISFLASLGCLALIYLLVRRESGDRFAGFVAAGLFAATFRLSGAWLDLARVDSLGLCLFLAAVVMLRFDETRRGLVLAGVLVVLSALTKQQAMLMSLPLMAYCARVYRTRSLWFVGTVIVLFGGSALWLNAVTDGWYSFYVFELPGHHKIRWDYLILFWTRDVWPALALAFLASVWVVLGFAERDGKRGILRKPIFFYICLFAGMLAAAWSSRMHAGGYDNALFPACAALAIGLGLFVAWLEAHQSAAHGVRAFLYFVVLLQLANLFYNPADQVPDKADREAGDALVALMSSYKGDVWLTHHGYLPELSGKQMYTHPYAIFDIQQLGGPVADKVFAEIRAEIASQRFEAIICDRPGVGEIRLEPYYQIVDTVFASPSVFRPVTGAPVRPEYLFEAVKRP